MRGLLLSSKQKGGRLDQSGGSEIGKRERRGLKIKITALGKGLGEGQLAFAVKRNVNYFWQKTLAVHTLQLTGITLPLAPVFQNF